MFIKHVANKKLAYIEQLIASNKMAYVVRAWLKMFKKL